MIININLKKVVVLLTCMHCFFMLGFSQISEKNKKNWFPVYDFTASQFKVPPLEFGPLARWWWPGNDVTNEELQREINLFADNAFGGVEIQTLTNRLPIIDKEARERVMSWDTPVYYEHVRTVMEEARKRGLTVDITNGSGWPTGGPYLKPEEGFINLLFAAKDIQGGNQLVLPVPPIKNETGVPARLAAVLAVKALQKKADDKSTTIPLDASSTLVLTDHVKNDSLYWTAPVGDWKIIAFWSKPNSLTGSWVAGPKQGPLLNLFDSLAVKKNNEYLFGPRTGLEAYYGNPMRAIFTDSYEFAVDRHYSLDFMSFFKKRRGYDVTPWLPANMQKGYNFVSFSNPNKDPDFKYSSEDWRLKYDYDITLAELLDEHFIKTSSNWTEKRGLAFRTQAYGFKLDNIASAGHASIPETESMSGAEASLKIQASGAHLYNRPILSCESAVYMYRSYMTTPQKLRLIVDKLFTAGVNQIIYHGVPYKYINDKTIPEGWTPFGNKYSSSLGEGNIFWKYQKELNEYISRSQYALRSGKSHADVLIYLPFLRPEIPFNPEEILKGGYLEGVEPPLPASSESQSSEDVKWAKIFYPFINQLEASGFTWDWVNDASIQEAMLDDDKQINIRGNRYQALVLVDDSLIEMKTAQKINAMAKRGMNFLAIGKLPSKQPSWLNWETNDKITEQQIVDALKSKNSVHVSSGNNFEAWFKTLNQSVKFNDKYTFARQIEREMSDGSRLQFIWNKSDAWQPLSLTLNKKYKNAYWLNAETGTMTRVDDLGNVSMVIPPYSSIILFAGTKSKIEFSLLSNSELTVIGAKKILEIEKWDVNSGKVSIKDTLLFDWKTNERFKYSSQLGVYRSSFQLDEVNPQSIYFIELGKVYYTAEVEINGKPAGKRINAPFSLNVSEFLQKGKNTIEVRVTLGQLNGFIGEAEKGDNRYNEFKMNTGLLSSGLVGPVVLYEKL